MAPGTEAAYDDQTRGGDLFPSSQEEHSRMLRWALEAITEADGDRKAHHDRWLREYNLYRSWVERPAGDWRSKMFIPHAFYIIETITPKLVAQLPKFIVAPVGPEDLEASKLMEDLLNYAADRTGLYEQLVASWRQALKYGTGILQTFWDAKMKHRRIRQPVMEPVTRTLRIPETAPGGEQLMDVDGAPMYRTEEQSLGERPTGQVNEQMVEFPLYTLPAAEFVDISNFWPAPEATSLDDARYVIHRTFKDDRYVRKLIAEGTYVIPDWIVQDETFWGSETEPKAERLEQIDLGGGAEPTRRRAELLSFWTDETCLVMLNRRAIVRAFTNPYDHGEKPFIRILDHYQEGEFWGVGELETVEGMQDGVNALWNSRVDNLRLAMQKVFYGDPSKLHDLRDLNFHPGGMIRTKGNVLPSEAIAEFPMSDITQSAYQESAELERMIEKVTGVSAYQTGSDSPDLNQTATGVALISEQGNSRFALKIRMSEITGLARLARHFGSLIQQFMPPEMVVRRRGDEGAWLFEQLTPEGISGELDYDIEAESSTVTESLRKDQKLSLLQIAIGTVDPMTGQPIANVRQFFMDVLEEFGVKDFDRYLTPTDPMALLQRLLGSTGAQPGAVPGGGQPGSPSGEAPAPGPAAGAPSLAVVGSGEAAY